MIFEERRLSAREEIEEQRPSALKLKNSACQRSKKLMCSAHRRKNRRRAPVGAMTMIEDLEGDRAMSPNMARRWDAPAKRGGKFDGAEENVVGEFRAI